MGEVLGMKYKVSNNHNIAFYDLTNMCVNGVEIKSFGSAKQHRKMMTAFSLKLARYIKRKHSELYSSLEIKHKINAIYH